MKRKFLKFAAALLSYLILNAGVLGWIRVSAASGSTAGTAEAVMAMVSADTDSSRIRISILGKEAVLDLSATESVSSKSAAAAFAEPLLLAVWAVFSELYDW